MPCTTIRGVSINYEILGDRGPAMMLCPGGRNAFDNVMPIAERMAKKGYRVLLHDRRNCGASDVAFDRTKSEYEIWADDLDLLLKDLGMSPAIAGGSSSGARLSLLFALRYPQATRALLLWRVTGGRFAVERLSEKYYGHYIRIAGEAGMAAVCADEHFAELIRHRPGNRDRLMAMDPKEFVATMRAWREPFIAGAAIPVIGTTEADLRTIQAPACIIPGDDRTHPGAVGVLAGRLIADSEVHRIFPVDRDLDVTPIAEWMPHVDRIAAIFDDFLSRKLGRIETAKAAEARV